MELTTICNDTYDMLIGTLSYADYQIKARSTQGKPSSGLKTLGILMLILGTAIATIGVILAPTVTVTAGVAIATIGMGFFTAGRKPIGLSEAMSNIANARFTYERCIITC